LVLLVGAVVPSELQAVSGGSNLQVLNHSESAKVTAFPVSDRVP